MRVQSSTTKRTNVRRNEFKIYSLETCKFVSQQTNQQQRTEEYNLKHGITPKTIKKSVRDTISITKQEDIGVEFKMENSDDLETCLEEFSNVHKWAKQILNIIRKNPQVRSQFYQDFRKAALNYWIQVTKNNGKVITVKSNKLSGYYYIIDKNDE